MNLRWIYTNWDILRPEEGPRLKILMNSDELGTEEERKVTAIVADLLDSCPMSSAFWVSLDVSDWLGMVGINFLNEFTLDDRLNLGYPTRANLSSVTGHFRYLNSTVPYMSIYYNTWLVVWNIWIIFPYYMGISSSQLTNSYFSRWLIPPTSNF